MIMLLCNSYVTLAVVLELVECLGWLISSHHLAVLKNAARWLALIANKTSIFKIKSKFKSSFDQVYTKMVILAHHTSYHYDK